MNTSLKYAVVAAEAVSIFVSLILLYGNIFETRRKTRYGRVYSWMVATIVLALFSDAVVWALEGDPAYTSVIYLSNTVSILLSIVLIAQFVLYITLYINERKKTSRKMLRAGLIFCSVSIVASLIACICGGMFTVENGICVLQPFYEVYSLAVVLAMLSSLVAITKYRKVLGLHDSIAAYAYILIPNISAIINLWSDQISFTYPAVTVAALELYVMIQSEQSSRLMEEREISAYYAEHDELTGLLSRRSYVEALDRLSKSDKNAGVVFCDLNGLKYANDHFGHQEGDGLLRSFADLLRKQFRDEDLYRISGDEFVVIAERIGKEEFLRKVAEFERVMNSDGLPLACAGSDYGPAKDTPELLQKAEDLMYKQKKIFHRNHPEMHRYDVYK